MDKRKLCLQQYLGYHPISKRNEKIRVGYVSLVCFFADKYAGKSEWSKGMKNLFKQIFLEKGKLVNVQETKEGKIIIAGKNTKYFKYRYNLLTDCLFICAFDDVEKGREILNEICNFYGKMYSKKIKMIFRNFYTENHTEIKKIFPKMADIYRIIWNNRKFMELPEKKIMITANMSAGKSTLLNAFTGKKVNKTQNDTCTAKIHILYNKAGEDNLNYEWDHDLELNASHEILMTDNEVNTSTTIYVGTRFKSLNEIDRRICFIDTPGVNSSQNIEHKEIARKAISEGNCDLMIYLLNGENIGTDDDIKHMRFVIENYEGRIIFLVNKLDKYKKDIDSVKETIKTVKKDLEDLGCGTQEVYPISAYAAYLAKMEKFNCKISEDERDDLEYLKRKLSRDEFQYNLYYGNDAEEIDKSDELDNLLLHSGILNLENIIYE